MYKGFNLENISEKDLLIKTDKNKSFEEYNYSNFKQIEKSLTNFILNDGSIKATDNYIYITLTLNVPSVYKLKANDYKTLSLDIVNL